MIRAGQTIGRMRSRRGMVGLVLAVVIMALMFSITSGYLLAITAGGVKSEQAIRQMQAVAAAEAGLDVAAQAGGTVVGECGRARYAAMRRGGEVAAMGEVLPPSGGAARCAVVARMGAGGIERGTWRQVPPASRPELARLLGQRAD